MRLLRSGIGRPVIEPVGDLGASHHALAANKAGDDLNMSMKVIAGGDAHRVVVFETLGLKLLLFVALVILGVVPVIAFANIFVAALRKIRHELVMEQRSNQGRGDSIAVKMWPDVVIAVLLDQIQGLLAG